MSTANQERETLLAAEYAAAEEFANQGEMAKAAMAFGKLGNYQDAKQRSFALWDTLAVRHTFSAGLNHVVGLSEDGTVMVAGSNSEGQCDVSDWADIVAISAGTWHTVGLKADGTVISTGQNRNGECEVANWRDIVAIGAGNGHTIGLKSDGTVVAVGENENDDGECEVSGWTDIAAVCADENHTFGLKKDGTVVATKSFPGDIEYDLSDWDNIKLP